MLDTVLSMSFLTLMEIIGPAVLLAALIYGVSVAGHRRRSKRQAADQATREGYSNSGQSQH
jgi:hypothetical protein